jgi:NTP pyrophosphatase (non-canonical NTP hydrolase)
MTWLDDYSAAAAETDQLPNSEDHVRLLAAGLAGETGSILAELKKAARERDAYPEYRERLLEEVGDALWYLTRLATLVGGDAAAALSDMLLPHGEPADPLTEGLRVDAAVGDLARSISSGDNPYYLVRPVASALAALAASSGVPLDAAANFNLEKITSRWPREFVYHGFFDDDVPEEDQLPRHLEVEFRELVRGDKHFTLLRCNDLNFGDRVTDNIEGPDFYRYHDIFHFSHAVHLGWSPVVRALLRTKRKSDPAADEQQDGARAIALEEAVTAIVFARAKKLAFFDGLNKVDYDLLKTIHSFLQGYEGGKVPLWQWERAILEGYRIFRLLREHRGGHVTLDLPQRKLHYVAPTTAATILKRA